MLAENYPYMIFNREMKRVCDTGTLGKFLFAEGEYNHPVSAQDKQFTQDYKGYPTHWRNFLPRTYYITHSLAPLMHVTGARPKRVTAFPVYAPLEEEYPTGTRQGDRAAVITCLNDDDSVFRVTGCAAWGAHGNSYRYCCTKGQIENIRGGDGKVMLRYNDWAIPEGMEENNLYDPSWNDKDEELIKQSGHGGGDYITSRMFLECLSEKKQPALPFDIYSAVNMSAVAILAHRSILNDGKAYAIPDYRNEDVRKELEKDTLSPFYYSDGREPTIPCCSKPDYRVAQEQLDNFIELMKD
jgi:predicted dehydrogenase